MDALQVLIAPQTQQSRAPTLTGVVTAKVIGPVGDNLFSLNYLTMGADQPSAPARVMMPMAGGKRGTYFIPDQGDEVVVAFEHGDVNFPIIIGAVWNQNDPVPSQADTSAANNVRTIVSRSGHEVTLDDTPGAEKVTIKTQGGQSLVLDDTGAGTVTLTAMGGASITMDALSISLSASGSTLTLDASGVTMDTPGIVSMTAAGGFTLMSTAIITMTAPAGINLVTTGQPLVPVDMGSLVTLL
jgi:uncharacterized protein involved in type VI secretion and phage assembly